MPDISMCTNTQCPLSNECYRYRATPNLEWQAYGGFKPNEDGTCDHFIEMAQYPDNNN
jgi:hypothetical protein